MENVSRELIKRAKNQFYSSLHDSPFTLISNLFLLLECLKLPQDVAFAECERPRLWQCHFSSPDLPSRITTTESNEKPVDARGQ